MSADMNGVQRHAQAIVREMARLQDEADRMTRRCQTQEAEIIDLRRKLHAAATVRCWTNEDRGDTVSEMTELRCRSCGQGWIFPTGTRQGEQEVRLHEAHCATSILTRWRNRPISPRRARAMYEAQRLRFLAEDLDRENARREQERDRPCPWCAAFAPTDTEEPQP